MARNYHELKSGHLPFSKDGSVPVRLSEQAQQVSAFARQRGDTTYLMVDKADGSMTLFEKGKPSFQTPVLTGASDKDDISPSSLSKKSLGEWELSDKVTPAGLYGVSQFSTAGYGRVLKLEPLAGSKQFDRPVEGEHWAIGVHPVALNHPGEQRMQRLMSPTPSDNNISTGCMNVRRDALEYIAERLPVDRQTPIYILPRDKGRTAEFFSRQDRGHRSELSSSMPM